MARFGVIRHSSGALAEGLDARQIAQGVQHEQVAGRGGGEEGAPARPGASPCRQTDGGRQQAEHDARHRRAERVSMRRHRQPRMGVRHQYLPVHAEGDRARGEPPREPPGDGMERLVDDGYEFVDPVGVDGPGLVEELGKAQLHLVRMRGQGARARVCVHHQQMHRVRSHVEDTESHVRNATASEAVRRPRCGFGRRTLDGCQRRKRQRPTSRQR